MAGGGGGTLTGAGARLGDSSLLPAAREGERRSQAFFYRPDPGSADGSSGILGLPIARDPKDGAARRFRGSGSAVAFLRRDDGCVVSCIDWYGNARPIFLNGRIFALTGYELVGGQLRGQRIAERRRIDFAPPTVGR